MIEIRHADKTYNRGSENAIHAIDDVTLSLPETGMVAIFGKSGCGKTTLLNAIGGLDRLDRGEILLGNESLTKNPDAVRGRYIGMIFQNYNLQKQETVYENVADALRLCGLTDDDGISERVLAALSCVGMEKFKNRLPDTLSGGQQQRVAIARAIVKNPPVLLADEPTGNLDEANTILIMDILKQISRDHLVLLVTHEESLVDHYCDRVIGIVDGGVRTDRQNEDASGYRGRSKNEIYLGELAHRTETAPGISIEYFGEPAGEIRLRVVRLPDGRIFLKSDTKELRILDETSEMKLREGVYREEAAPDATASAAQIDLPPLPPKKTTGRLFTLTSSILSGLHNVFPKRDRNRRRPGRKLLRLSMILMACVVVFMSSNFAVCIRDYRDLQAKHNESVFYLPVKEDTDTTWVSNSIGQNGIDHARIVGSTNEMDHLNFGVGNFVTADLDSLRAEGTILDASLADSLDLVAGTKTTERLYDVLITTAVADRMISSCPGNYLRTYSDLLSLVSESIDGQPRFRITGVVRSSEENIYLQSTAVAYIVLSDQYYSRLPVLPASLDTLHSGDIADGNVVLLSRTVSGMSVGEPILILGKTFTLSEIITLHDSADSFVPLSAPTFDAFFDEADSDSVLQVLAEWFFEYATLEYREYLRLCDDLTLFDYIYLQTGAPEALISSFDTNDRLINLTERFLDYPFSSSQNTTGAVLYAAYLYHQENGVYPTEEEISIDEGAYQRALAPFHAHYTDPYLEYLYNNPYNGYMNHLVLSDTDYATLAYLTGENAPTLPQDLFYSYSYGDDSVYYAYYLRIHANNVAVAREYLRAHYGETLIEPEDVYEEMKKEGYSSIAANTISLFVLLGLISVSLYFIMRSSLISRIREIGIYRAIGVSKRNLTFRFLVETIVLTTLTLLIGYLLAAFLVGRLASVPYFSNVFYFPFWFAAVLLLLLYGVAILFGTLPVRLLLRKSPSEILAKYDV